MSVYKAAEWNYVPGEYWVVCDRCGFKVRRKDSLMEWNGLRVCKDDWEIRHPQDFVRGTFDKQTVWNPRPQPTDTFVALDATARKNSL